MAPSVDSSAKPMRKGTRSCKECRRRKIKCTWTSAAASICNECTKHSRECIAQGYTLDAARVDKPESLLKVKVKRIESMFERISKMQNDQAIIEARDENGCSFERVQHSVLDGSDLGEHASITSPLFRLFNNEVITQSDEPIAPQIETTSTINFGSKDSMSDLEKLKSTISHDPDILAVIDVSSEWWISWRDQQWVLRAGKADPTMRDFVQERLDSTDPVVYATGLICIAMSLHRLRPGLDDDNLTLSAPPLVLYDRIVTAIDQVVLSRQPSGQAGILLALQRAKTHAEGDQLRKSWLRVRHAILLSQHLNFTDDPSVSQDELTYRQRWVGGIYELDHFLSLVLGFPQARDKSFSDRLAKTTLLDPAVNIETRMRALRRILAVIAGRINNHNAKGHKPDPDFTYSIAQEMTTYAAAMPVEWWQADHHLESTNMQLAHEHLMAQLWFWETSAFLHLPHMLDTDTSQSPTSREQSTRSRDLCLHSCREMLRVFCLLRGTPSLSVYICSCEDFQGVITSAMLLVGILLGVSRGDLPSVETLEEDFAIIQEVKEIFRYRGTTQGGSISRQGLKVIETLESFMTEGNLEDSTERSRSIILPYFGLIRIESKIPPLNMMRQKMDNLDLDNVTLAQYPTGFTSPPSLDQPYLTDPDNSLFDPTSLSTNPYQSPSSGSHAPSDDVFDKPIPPSSTEQNYDADFNPNIEDFTDLWMFGGELGQAWDLPDWHETFDAWNGTGELGTGELGSVT